MILMAGRFVPFVCEDAVQFLIVRQGAGPRTRIPLLSVFPTWPACHMESAYLGVEFYGLLGKDHEHDGDGSPTL